MDKKQAKPVPPNPVRNDSLRQALEELKKEPTVENNVSFLNEVVRAKLLAAMVRAQREQMAGFVINPKGDNIVFPTDMILKMAEEMEREDKEKEN